MAIETIPMAIETIPAIVVYHSKWSVALFTSSIMLASFLFTMKAFIIQTVKTQIYDSEEHIEKVRQRINSGAKTQFYGGLKRLALLLKWTIILAITNAFSQLTLSGFDSVMLSIFCLVLSGVTATLFLIVVWIVSQNISDMISDSEKKVGKKDTN